jgi:uncharacterized membrane protein YdfJ with MMPL/SSD domain
MAEIKIEKKQPIWPWILGILVLAGLVYFFFLKDKDLVTNQTTITTDTIVDRNQMLDETNENLTGVAAFVAFVKKDDGNMTLDHEYSNEALNKLIDATEEVSSKVGFDSKADLEEAREHAGKITNNPEATDHADHIKMTTDKISTVLQNLQSAKFPNLKAEADKAKMSSQAINVKELTLNQKEKVKGFFADAADLLDKMNR